MKTLRLKTVMICHQVYNTSLSLGELHLRETEVKTQANLQYIHKTVLKSNIVTLDSELKKHQHLFRLKLNK